MTLPDIRLSSELLWLITIITALLDAALIAALSRRAPHDQFRHFHWPIMLASGVFWISYGLTLFWLSWDSFYSRFLPRPIDSSLARMMIELLPYAFIGLAMWWLASKLPGNPVVSFCLLGGVQSIFEHLWGVYRHGMLEKVPFLQDASVVSVLAFATAEYILYWGSVLWIAIAIFAVKRRLVSHRRE